MITLSIEFNTEYIPPIIIIKKENSYKIGEEAFDDFNEFKSWFQKKIEKTIREETPNIVIMKYLDENRLLDERKLDNLSREYIFYLIKHKKEEPAYILEYLFAKLIKEIMGFFAHINFIDEYSKSIHGVTITYGTAFPLGKCKVCGSPVFHDFLFDADLCFRCDCWLSTPCIGDDFENDTGIYPPEKPSLRLNYVKEDNDSNRTNEKADMDTSLKIIIKNINKEYKFQVNGKSDFLLINSVDEDITFNSITELIKAASTIVERLSIKNHKLEENIEINFKTNIFLNKKDSMFGVGTNIDEIQNFLIDNIMYYLIEAQLWIAPQ